MQHEKATLNPRPFSISGPLDHGAQQRRLPEVLKHHGRRPIPHPTTPAHLGKRHANKQGRDQDAIRQRQHPSVFAEECCKRQTQHLTGASKARVGSVEHEQRQTNPKESKETTKLVSRRGFVESVKVTLSRSEAHHRTHLFASFGGGSDGFEVDGAILADSMR